MNLSNYDLRFTLFGVPVRVMPTFWLLCVLFSPFTKGFNGGSSWLFGLLGWSAAVFLSFLAHEFGHALASRRLVGARPSIDMGIGRTLSGGFVFGGVCAWTPNERTNQAKRAAIAAAGPCAALLASAVLLAIAFLCGNNFIMAGILGVPIVPLPDKWMGLMESGTAHGFFLGCFVYGFLQISVLWSFVNLFPIFPLDGGHVLFALLCKKDSYGGAQKALKISVGCALVVAILFLLDRSYFAALFFAYLAYQNYQAVKRLSFFK